MLNDYKIYKDNTLMFTNGSIFKLSYLGPNCFGLNLITEFVAERRGAPIRRQELELDQKSLTIKKQYLLACSLRNYQMFYHYLYRKMRFSINTRHIIHYYV